MDKLKELIGLVNLNKVKSIKIIGNGNDKDSKLDKLYLGVLNGKITTDEQALKILYPNSKSKNPYYKLKHTLRDRLYNTAFFIDVKSSKYSDIKRAKFTVQRLLGLFNILLDQGVRKNAVYIAEKALEIATKFELTEERLFLARNLRRYAATRTGNQRLFCKYDTIVNEAQQLLIVESMAESCYYKIIALYVNDKSTKPYIFKQASQYIEELEAMEFPSQTADLVYHIAMIRIAKFMSINDYKSTLAVCEKSLAIIEKYPFKHTRSLVSISGQAVACCIQLQKYEQGEINISRGLKLLEEGVFNWFKYNELHLTLSLHTGRYKKAWEIYEQSTNHARFKKLGANVQEVWKIYYAWLYFLMKAGQIEIAKEKIDSHQLRINRYLNDIPTFSKDKRGMNVSVLLSHILLLLQRGKYERLIDRFEAIAKYKDRYLDKEHNLRSNIFIRMLLEIPKAMFNKKEVIRKTEKYVKKLEEVPLDIANQSYDIEILPFEQAWDIILVQLGRSKF